VGGAEAVHQDRAAAELTGTTIEALFRGAPRGLRLHCRGWEQEGALRCLLNNLDPDVAEDAGALVVYGGRGRAARSPEGLAGIVAALERLGPDETLVSSPGRLWPSSRGPRPPGPPRSGTHGAGTQDGHVRREAHGVSAS
jgi:hypothetical protein